jgi:glycosyltransferase involved in cell wall biosynthesis
MTSDQPLVTIGVPTYNSAAYLRESLDSILAQTYPNCEIIVSDNASQDGTVAILREYAGRSGIRLLLNSDNAGAGGNFNRMVEAARGEYVAIYHSDDTYRPTIVEESVRRLNADPAIGLVGTMADVIDSRGTIQYGYELHDAIRRLNRQVFDFDDALLGVLTGSRNKIFFVTPSIMVRRKAYQELGLFDQPTYSSSVDTEMWLRIATRYRVAILDKRLMSYRVHETQGSQLEVRKNVQIPDIFKVITDYRHHISRRDLNAYCGRALDRTLLKTALKQNCIRQFGTSSMTLAGIRTPFYRLCRLFLAMANGLHINLKVWP